MAESESSQMRASTTRWIGLETSSIMPLVEVTTRTLPLQCEIKKALEDRVKFKTDRYSIMEAKQQIITSYENALRSLAKAKKLAKSRGIRDRDELIIVFVKSLAENWYGREETLRWSDVTLAVDSDGVAFFDELEQSLEMKKEGYLSILKVDSDVLIIKATEMKRYWISPEFENSLVIEVEVCSNKTSLHDFFQMFQPIANSLYREKITINDAIDLYHLFSLYHDGEIKEVWSCNQNFVRRHEKYLKALDDKAFSILFKDTKIKRIK